MRRLLVEMREGRGLSRERLAELLGVNVRSVTRWESGEHTPQMAQRVAIADALGRPLADVLRALEDHADIPLPPTYRAPMTGLDMLTMLERSCRQLRTVELTIVPGLLQVPAYAAAVESLDPDRPTPKEIARRVTARVQRQRALDKAENPLHLEALIDPSVLHSDVGGPVVMAEQVGHLHAVDERPNVSIRVLSAAARIVVARGPFTLLSGDDPDPFMVVTDDLSSGLSYRDGPTVVGIHQDLWRYIWSVSDALA